MAFLKKYANERPAAESKTYATAEDAARAAKRGLWVDANAMSPWEWRDGGQQAHAVAKESSGQCDCSTALKSAPANAVVATVLPTTEKSGT